MKIVWDSEWSEGEKKIHFHPHQPSSSRSNPLSLGSDLLFSSWVNLRCDNLTVAHLLGKISLTVQTKLHLYDWIQKSFVFKDERWRWFWVYVGLWVCIILQDDSKLLSTIVSSGNFIHISSGKFGVRLQVEGVPRTVNSLDWPSSVTWYLLSSTSKPRTV